jgi:hypothetical protein
MSKSGHWVNNWAARGGAANFLAAPGGGIFPSGFAGLRGAGWPEGADVPKHAGMNR